MPQKPRNPVSQWITNNGCLIQGVMNNESEINWIYCPIHNKMEHVHSFDREIDMRSSPNKFERKLIEVLKIEYSKRIKYL